jgi:hypothetical protein
MFFIDRALGGPYPNSNGLHTRPLECLIDTRFILDGIICTVLNVFLLRNTVELSDGAAQMQVPCVTHFDVSFIYSERYRENIC